MEYSQKYNACVYPYEARLVGLGIVGSAFDKERSIIPCTLKNMQIMAALGYEAMSPIMVDYDWPIKPGRKPYTHQKHMSAFMTLHPHCFNLSDMGTAKTMATLWAWDYLMLKGEVDKVLIVCTMSCMEDVWQREIVNNFLGRRRAVIVHGDRARRAERLKEEADFYILNHDGLALGTKHEMIGKRKKFEVGALARYIEANPRINGITIDEGGELRHQSTDVYKSAERAIKNKPYLQWLTGTPTPKEPIDAYAQAKMVRHDFKESFTGFRERTMYKQSTFQWKPKADGYDIAASILKPAIRYKIEDCIELPELVTEDRTAQLSAEQNRAMKELRKSLKTMVDNGEISAINEASLRIKLLQIACGAVYGSKKEVFKLDCGDRIKILKETIEQSTAKVLVFAPFTSVVDMLYSELEKEYKVDKITGSVSMTKRGEIFRDFREGSLEVIVADPGTMAHGIDGTAASTTVWFAPTDNPETYQQANRRFRRAGQKNNMLLLRIASTSTERKIYERLENCQSLQGVMLDLIQGII